MQPHEDVIEFMRRAIEGMQIVQEKEETGNLQSSDYDLQDLAQDFREVADHIDNQEFDKILNN